jgi:hypothetical protein
MQDVTVSAALEEKAPPDPVLLDKNEYSLAMEHCEFITLENGCLKTLNFFNYQKSRHKEFVSFNYCFELSE